MCTSYFDFDEFEDINFDAFEREFIRNNETTMKLGSMKQVRQ